METGREAVGHPLLTRHSFSSLLREPAQNGEVPALLMVAKHSSRHAALLLCDVLPFPVAPLSEAGVITTGLAQADGSPFCSPTGQRNGVALWDRGRAEAAGHQRGLWALGHSGSAQGTALRGHGQHPVGAIRKGDGTGPAGPPCPAAGEPHCLASLTWLPQNWGQVGSLPAANPSFSKGDQAAVHELAALVRRRLPRCSSSQIFPPAGCLCL